MNGEEQRAHWDLKYEQGLPSLTQPDPFFISAYRHTQLTGTLWINPSRTHG